MKIPTCKKKPIVRKGTKGLELPRYHPDWREVAPTLVALYRALPAPTKDFAQTLRLVPFTVRLPGEFGRCPRADV